MSNNLGAADGQHGVDLVIAKHDGRMSVCDIPASVGVTGQSGVMRVVKQGQMVKQ